MQAIRAAGFGGGDLLELFTAQRRSWPIELVHLHVDNAAAPFED